MIESSRSLEMDQDVEMPASAFSVTIFRFFLIVSIYRIKRPNWPRNGFA